MIETLRRYARWLHTRWPAARIEPYPVVSDDGRTRVPGLWVAGDLRGVPLLKFALDTGARTVAAIAAAPQAGRAAEAGTLDLVIVGAGVSGMAAAIEARRRGIGCTVVEGAQPFATIADFPTGKPIFTYPSRMVPAGALQVQGATKEALLDELRRQAEAAGVVPRPGWVEGVRRRAGGLEVMLRGGESIRARHVLIAAGRSGGHRALGVPGEDLPHVFHRVYDPADQRGRSVLVVGGGDAAVETALALSGAGARVTLVHRGDALARPKPELLDAVARAPIDVRLGTRVVAVHPREVELDAGGARTRLAADAVFPMIGRAAPVTLLRACGVRIAGERGPAFWASLTLALLFTTWLYDWKSGGFSAAWFRAHGWFPYDLPARLEGLGGGVARAAADPHTVLGTLAVSAAGPSFWYTLAYSVVVTVFGVRRIRTRRTPYVTAQTLTLMAVQVVPLFLLPELVLPWLDRNGLLARGLADALFPAVDYGHGREFWRAYGFVLAWPLNVYNVFTPEPLPWWIAIAALQTLVLIPIGVHVYGKGAYCGWICSCGALAETLGDGQRHKMPHGPGWNRLNLAGQAVLGIAVALLAVRIAGWSLPDGNPFERVFDAVLKPGYTWGVDLFLAGVIGYGAYFWFSGRVWCRFLCPLAALMHVYARFSSFRILAAKERCISCGQCTRTCHQGIDVMTFAQRGAPMEDPQCVRCGACVHVCPTAVLAFGRVSRAGGLIGIDGLEASPVRIRERNETAP